jgi:hypothetical protein
VLVGFGRGASGFVWACWAGVGLFRRVGSGASVRSAWVVELCSPDN